MRLVSSALHQFESTIPYFAFDTVLRPLSLILRVTIFELVASQIAEPGARFALDMPGAAS
jgi:hypothetical protein